MKLTNERLHAGETIRANRVSAAKMKREIQAKKRDEQVGQLLTS